MLLTCPHCADIAEIPSIFQKFNGMPIACHACNGVFYVPPHIKNNEKLSVRDHHSKTHCSSCRVALLVPDFANIPRNEHPEMECPACRGNVFAPRLTPNIGSSGMIAAIIIGGCIGAMIIILDRNGLVTAELNGLQHFFSDMAINLANNLGRLIDIMITNISNSFKTG